MNLVQRLVRHNLDDLNFLYQDEYSHETRQWSFVDLGGSDLDECKYFTVAKLLSLISSLVVYLY